MATKPDVLSPADAVTEAVQSMESTGDVIADLFERAYALTEAKEVVQDTRAAVRDSLRNLATAGLLSDEQRGELAELFPPRERKGKDEQATEPVDAE